MLFTLIVTENIGVSEENASLETKPMQAHLYVI